MTGLTIYEKHPTADAYRVGGFYSPYALVSQDKRFTDAELAAEYHSTDLEQEQATILRFATLPHYDKDWAL
jgi:hypothetical protein